MTAARLHVLDLRGWRPFSNHFPRAVSRDFPSRADAEQARPARDGDRMLSVVTDLFVDDSRQLDLFRK